MSKDSARILVVDDEERMRELMERGLRRANYDCATASSADHAARLLKQRDGKFDLVLLDIIMPGKSGIEYLSELTMQYSDVAVIMLTGITDVSSAVRAMREGAYDYAIKPVNLGELVIRIETALARRALSLENRLYQHRQEQLVNELNTRLEQRRREMAALNNLFQSALSQTMATAEAYASLRKALNEFTSQVDKMADLASIIHLNEGVSTLTKVEA